MSYKSKAVAILATDTDVYTVPATLEGACVLGIGNTTGGALTVTMKFYKSSLGTTTTIFSGKSIPAGELRKMEIPFLMEAGDKIQLAGSSTGLTAFASVPESSATPPAQGFVPKGTYSSIATYDINDLVDDGSGNSYISRVAANLNHAPGSSPTQWMVLSLRGLTGAGDFTGPGASVDSDIVHFSGTTGKIGKTLGYSIGTTGANKIGLLNGNNNMGGANTYDKTQTPNEGTITTAVAADFSTKQKWRITANGSAVTIANPTSPVDKTIYDIAIVFTTSHGCSFGANFKIGDYVPTATAGKEDRISFEYDSAATLFKLRGYRKDVGT